MHVTKQQNTHNKRVTALIGMLHAVSCILFILHQSLTTLRGTTVLRVVMNSKQRGGDGKSRVFAVVNLKRYSGNGADCG